MKNIFVIAVIVLGLSHLVLGQENKQKTIRASIYAFQYHKDFKKVFFFNIEGEIEEISLSTANIRGPYKAKLNKSDEFVLRTVSLNDDGETIYPAIAEIKIPSSINDALIVLTPKGNGYGGLVMDRDITNFSQGGYKMVNFSPDNIRGLVGATQVVAPAKKITTFDASKNADSVMKVKFQYHRDGVWKTFLSSRWPRESDKRQLLCAYVDPNTKRTKIRGLVIR